MGFRPRRRRQEINAMSSYPEGTVLTCSHEDCNCRVLIQAECHCPGAEGRSAYHCACGAELVPVAEN
jgi:hypothetical protein